MAYFLGFGNACLWLATLATGAGYYLHGCGAAALRGGAAVPDADLLHRFGDRRGARRAGLAGHRASALRWSRWRSGWWARASTCWQWASSAAPSPSPWGGCGRRRRARQRREPQRRARQKRSRDEPRSLHLALPGHHPVRLPANGDLAACGRLPVARHEPDLADPRLGAPRRDSAAGGGGRQAAGLAERRAPRRAHRRPLRRHRRQGCGAYMLFRRSLIAGVIAGEAVLVASVYLWGP